MRKVKAQLVRRGTFPQLHTILITYHFLSSHFPGMIKEQSRDAEQNFNCFFFFIFSSPLISFIRKPQVVPAAFVFLCARISGGLPARRWLPCVGGAFRHAITAHKIRRPYIAPPGDFRFSLFPLLFSLKRTPRKIQGVRFSCHSIQTVVSTGSPWTYLWSQSSSKSRERRSMGHPRARSSARTRNSVAGSRHSR